MRLILDFTTELFIKYAQGFIDQGVDFVMVADPSASGDMISRRQFEEFALPCLKKIFAAMAAKKVVSAVHICGNTTDRLDLLSNSGTRFVSLDYKVSLKKAREVFNGKVAFGGNVDPVGMMQQGTPEGVAAACEQCIADADGAKGGFILMPGCELPSSTPMENLKAMCQTGKNHRYR